MSVNIGGHTIESTSGGLNFDAAWNFLPTTGQGTSQFQPGFHGVRNGSPSGVVGSPWLINTTSWVAPTGALNAATGVYTCPITGIYACGFNFICRGGSVYAAGNNTYGYAYFMKNGVPNGQSHWNMTSNEWGMLGMHQVMSLAAGDTLSVGVVTPGASVAATGCYGDGHSSIWAILI